MKRSPLIRRQPMPRGKPLVKQRKKKAGAKVPSTPVLDGLFSLYVRRFGECELWGFGGVTCSTQLQCSHIHSRRFVCVRWDEGNAVCACAAHHRWQHDHPTLSTWALEEILGKEHLEALRMRLLKGDKPDRVAIAEWLRKALKDGT